jgi:CTP synthase (UTP-ammonia lyase)
MRTPKLALVGDRSSAVRSHGRIPVLLEALRTRDDVVLDAYWVGSDHADEAAFDRFDGIWLLPGSPYRSMEGAIRAARIAREAGIPFLGTCGGFQHALLMLAREAGIAEASHAEYGSEGERVIVALECSLMGHEGAVHSEPGSRFREITGVERTLERYQCGYGVDPAYVERLHASGVRFSAHDDAGDVRAFELPRHPFFLGTLFQPELAGDATRAHPIIRAFAHACTAHARADDRLATGAP